MVGVPRAPRPRARAARDRRGARLSVAAAVLAAGLGSRLESDTPKPLATLQGRPLVAWALAAVTATDLRPVLLVVGRRGNDVIAAAPPGVTAIHARSWRRGIAHSLRAALDALEPNMEVDAVCIGLADQPLVASEAYRRLAEAHGGGATLAAATYGGQRANPVLIARSLWGEARSLSGDVGARALMERHAVVEVDCTDAGSPADVDTLDDLRALEASSIRPDIRKDGDADH